MVTQKPIPEVGPTDALIRITVRFLFFAALSFAPPTAAQRVPLGSGSVVATVTRLKAGQYVWAPQAAPEGPMLLIVNLSTQRALAVPQWRADRRLDRVDR